MNTTTSDCPPDLRSDECFCQEKDGKRTLLVLVGSPERAAQEAFQDWENDPQGAPNVITVTRGDGYSRDFTVEKRTVYRAKEVPLTRPDLVLIYVTGQLEELAIKGFVDSDIQLSDAGNDIFRNLEHTGFEVTEAELAWAFASLIENPKFFGRAPSHL